MKKKHGTHRFSPRRLLVNGLCILLGINSLIATNGLWVELPVMVPSLPEGWKLPSYLTILIQIANVGPIAYALAAYKWPKFITEKRAIYMILVCGCSATALMIPFWSRSIWLFGDQRSVPLLVLTFFLALVDSVSSVVCLPFMAVLHARYVTSYMVGEALSGFLPSMVAMAQGVEEYTECANISVFNTTTMSEQFELQPLPPNPSFSPEIFFGFLFLLMLISSGGFILLNYLPAAKKEHVPRKNKKESEKAIITPEQVPLSVISDQSLEDKPLKPRKKHLLLLILSLQGWVSALGYGIFPSVQSYSCLPYGSGPFHYAVVLSSLATPVASIIAVFFPIKRASVIVTLTVIGTMICSYVMTTAVLSPIPPLIETKIGNFLLVFSWVSFTGLFGYVKVMIASMCRDIGHKALFLCGALTQAGSALGALIMFLLVSVFHLFHEKETC